jgi:hypothetical protein
MNLKIYHLTKNEEIQLIKGIKAAFAIPFIDSLEDFIWEGIFSYAKNIPLNDTLQEKRSKLLFDVVDKHSKIGWSAKAVQWAIKPNMEFELVIQRADIFKKRIQLGFTELSMESEPNLIGAALIRHWKNKIIEDAKIQSVEDMRVCILIKAKNNGRFMYFEEELAIYDEAAIEWNWTDSTRTGLQGYRKSDNFCVYRWYPNQKQFFERFKIAGDRPIFEVEPQRMDINTLIELLNQQVHRR